MPDVIVVKSMSGHTLSYAKKLAELLNLPLMTIRTAKRKLSKDTSILFMSWICEDKLVGYDQMMSFHIELVVAVGIMPYSEEMKRRIEEENQIYSGLFYLRGGINRKKLSLRKRLVLRSIRKDLKFKQMDHGLTIEQEEVLNSIENNLDHTNVNSLGPIVQYLSNEINPFVC